MTKEADLSVLIKLHKHELDEKRLALTALYSELALLERERRELERAFEREKEAVAVNGDIAFTFGAYTERVKQKRAEINAAEIALEERIRVAKDALMETFSELKKYEMTQEERDRLAAEERTLKEARVMDEVGLETHRRKRDE